MSGIVYDFDPYTSNLRKFWPNLKAYISGIKPSQTKMDPQLESLLSQISFKAKQKFFTPPQNWRHFPYEKCAYTYETHIVVRVVYSFRKNNMCESPPN